ncbi:MAG: flagellar motor protein MotB [Betaproteobacteria bacterium HGW-Betaproteobacteria-10]|nr:MAG: flagellar motor protein MotB [Betaproteobacteria bacterium HGW-Betaproteobacteria-10]
MALFRSAALGRKKMDHAAESPFWISFADQMTALMVLFLIALTVALYAVTEKVSAVEQQKITRQQEIATFLQRLRELTESQVGITLRGTAIDFGERARFEHNSHRINEMQSQVLSRFAPQVLALARDPLGQRWLKRISVVGFADASGNYLHNLNLSLQRSERVLCLLLVPPAGVEALSEADQRQVRELFIVSGASFNSQKNTAQESRRIELRLEFFENDEARQPPALPEGLSDKHCPLDKG